MSTRDLVLTALFAAIIVALGLLPPISLGFIPVPITAQSLGVMMAGVVLGARRGAIAVLIVLVLVAIGLPVLSGGRGGLAIFASPTAGFLIGWIFAAFVTGYLSERLVNEQQSGLVQTVSFFLTAMAGGIVVLYAFGITYLATVAGFGFQKAFIGSMAFIPGDVIKAFVAALLGRAVMVGYPLLPSRA
ncbi:biotin transporter BioY [Rhizobium leguminosarum]|uniref:Biotin transporter n=1 Tax=Rhizobium indigoferae TaxID=158891 RepID=A0ABZ0Z7M8_9HYPH|nr:MULTISPECIES: biotin transporter BioY [Rhizobium]MBA9031601.1 biotin transport system substrate-specific component [Rhizobium leguminosarum]MBY5917586.1 biotin transporter BioY [Rhizobium leguminosarum]MDV4159823.1 biotin transporter BioY [Rhizobium leguminosarum]MDV4170951.1 biotin transporter BioY [Rhizobium leguminosarum]NKK00725.1 BioY family transporter [Rhizobium leguminosarum bv. viciae]